ncbi:MAG: uroporphyrinogen decarboxylase superfamily, partial [Clostridiales bacterium]|nr:uroporphyrinogen decarboxylase superfamily [Clostridiales bacterium]
MKLRMVLSNICYIGGLNLVSRKEQTKRIKDLVDQYLEIVHSDKNKRNMELWKNPYDWNRDKLRALVPSKKSNAIPFIAEVDISLWRKFSNDTNLKDYYSDPFVNMEFQLQQKINHFKLFDDNFIYTDELYIWFGVVTELSIFGSEVNFYEHKEGWIKEPVLKNIEDIDNLTPPDFYKSGTMPKIHEFYEVMSELAEGKLKVMFPELARGPFCIAAHLRGLEDMLCDVKLEP